MRTLADGLFVLGNDAFDEGVAVAGAVGDHDLLVEFGSGGDDVRQLGEAFEQRTPIVNAVDSDSCA